MADEAPSSFPSHPQHSDLDPPQGGEAQSAESLPTPQQLSSEAPPRPAQSSIMQDTPSVQTTAAVPPSKQPHIPSIPSLQEPNPNQFAAMDTSNNPDPRPQDITMGGSGAAEQQQQQHHTPSSLPAAATGTGPAPKVRAGGAPARIFMNENIVPYLLEGMKTVTRDQPQNPLRALGEFLIQKSNEVEGPAGGGVNIKSESK